METQSIQRYRGDTVKVSGFLGDLLLGMGLRKFSMILGTNCSPKGYYPVGAAVLCAVIEIQQQHNAGSHAFC